MQYLGLKETAYDYIKEKLLKNEIKQGERIREDLLAEEIGVSRTPVREAINRLVAEGFVINIRRKGLFATEITNDEILKMLDVRVSLETLAVRLCCKYITDEEFDYLEREYHRYCDAMKNNDFKNASVYDGEMHKLISEYARNKKLSEYIGDLQEMVTYARARRDIDWTEEKKNNSLKDHANILKAIKERDEKAAEKYIEIDVRELRHVMKIEGE